MQGGGKIRPLVVVIAPHALDFAISLDQRDAVLIATTEPQIGEGLGIHREEAAGGAILRRHIGDGCPVGKRQLVQALAIELNEFADNAVFAQHLYHPEHQVSRGNTLLQLSAELKTDHIRDQHRNGLSQHGGLRLDTPHAPAQHTQAIDHGGMAVSTYQRVGVGEQALIGGTMPDRPGQILQVDLVADTGTRWHHPEVVEGPLPPFQELVALMVALHLHSHVIAKSAGTGELVNAH